MIILTWPYQKNNAVLEKDVGVVNSFQPIIETIFFNHLIESKDQYGAYDALLTAYNMNSL